jgi:hypothetical protein
LYFFSLK